MTAETDKAALRDNLVRACFDPGSFIGPRGVRTTDEWRADACLHLLASILAQAEADRAALDNAQKLNRDLHRRTQKAERFRARWGGSAVNYVIAKIKERRARRVAEARADRLAAEVEALRAEAERWRSVLWSVCGRLQLPRSEPSGPADDAALYEREIDALEDDYRRAERERVANATRMHAAEAALVRFAEAAKGIPFHVSGAAPAARVAQDARHPGTFTTLTVADFRRAGQVLHEADTVRAADKPGERTDSPGAAQEDQPR